MITEAYLSGGFRHYVIRRKINVWKYCRRAKIRDLHFILNNLDQVKRITVKLDGHALSDMSYQLKGNRIWFTNYLYPSLISKKIPWYRRIFSDETYELTEEPRTYTLEIRVDSNVLEGVYG